MKWLLIYLDNDKPKVYEKSFNSSEEGKQFAEDNGLKDPRVIPNKLSSIETYSNKIIDIGR